MPLRYYVQDQVPALMQAQSNQTYDAIAGAGANLGRALEKLGEEHKRTNTQAKAVEAFFGAMSDEEKASIGLPADMTQFKNLAAKDKIAFGQGIFQKQAFAQVGQQLRETAQRIKARETEELNMTRQPKFLAALSRYRQPTLEMLPAGEQGPPNLRPGMDVAGAAGRAAEETGFALPTPALSKLLEEMGQGEAADMKPEFTDIPGTDSVLARVGRSAYPVPKTTGTIASEDVTDDEGNPIGTVIRTPGAKPKFQARRASPRISEEFFKTIGEMAPGLANPKYAERTRAGIKAVIDAARIGKQIDDDQRDEFYATYGIGPTDSGPKPAKAAPAAGDRVTVEKDGKRFTLPKAQLKDAEKQGYKPVP